MPKKEPVPQLPTRLVPHLEADSTAPEPLEPGDVATQLSTAAIKEVSEEFGLVELSGNCARKLSEMGIGVDSLGSVQVANGMILVCSKALLKCTIHLQEGITDPKTAREAAKPLSEVAGAIKKMTDSMKHRMVTTAKPAPGPTRTPSFSADSPVQMVQVVVQKDS